MQLILYFFKIQTFKMIRRLFLHKMGRLLHVEDAPRPATIAADGNTRRLGLLLG